MDSDRIVAGLDVHKDIIFLCIMRDDKIPLDSFFHLSF